MSAIATSFLPGAGRALNVEPGLSRSFSRLNQLQTETRASTDLALVTAEGDRVTLSADALSQAVYTSYDARGRLRGQRLDVQADTLQLTSAQNRALHIEGDLNQQELADIQQVLDAVGALASDFFAGKLDKLPDELFDLDELETLRSVDATLEYSQSVTVSQLTQATRDASQQLPGGPRERLTPPLTPASPDSLPRELLPTDETASDRPARAVQFLQKLAQTLARQADDERPELRALHRLASSLLQRLPEDASRRVPFTASER